VANTERIWEPHVEAAAASIGRLAAFQPVGSSTGAAVFAEPCSRASCSQAGALHMKEHSRRKRVLSRLQMSTISFFLEGVRVFIFRF
jgi:hypothetical protein